MLLAPISYHNFMFGGVVAFPLFGLAIDETAILVRALMDWIGGSSTGVSSISADGTSMEVHFI